MIRINKAFLQYIIKLNTLGVAPAITQEYAAKGEKIITQRTSVFSVHVMEQGMAKCYLTEDTGNDFIQEFFGEGEVFGEIEVISNALSFCTIEALTPISYFKIPKAAFLDLLKSDELFNRLVLKLMANKIKYTALRHSYHQSHPLEANLKKLLQEFPDMLNKINKKDIANYLGITVRSLNRMIKAMS
ncbi:MAG: Crp/Fnr family transcriptional regulator [Bacteroidota bacterium]